MIFTFNNLINFFLIKFFLKAQKTSKIVDKIINNVESNIKVVEIPMKGRGIVSTK